MRYVCRSTVELHCTLRVTRCSFRLSIASALHDASFWGKHSTGRTPDETRMQVGGVFISRLVAALRPVQTRRDVLVPRVVTHSSGRVNTNVPQ